MRLLRVVERRRNVFWDCELPHGESLQLVANLVRLGAATALTSGRKANRGRAALKVFKTLGSPLIASRKPQWTHLQWRRTE